MLGVCAAVLEGGIKMKAKLTLNLKELLPPTILTIIVGVIANYFFLPAFNIESMGFWTFVVFVVLVFAIFYRASIKNKSKVAFVVYIVGAVAVLFIIGMITSSRLFNARRYARIIEPNIIEMEINTYEAKLDNVPLLDKDSAELLSNRELGSLVDVVSQFELGGSHQITMNSVPVRVTPLLYGDLIKWFNNRNEGTPGYIKINMRSQDAEIVRVEGGIKYSLSERFGRNLIRHLRKNYPTAMFESYNFELDEVGKPSWIVPVINHTIGIFGGADVDYVLVVDASTGAIEKHNIGEVPDWIDNVYSSELIVRQYDNYGSLQDGYLNSKFGQKGVRVTTNGYNYIPQGNDNWIYTGVTSIGTDKSNIGFILANKRTKEVISYAITGAEEFSAMSSARGVVQHLGYSSTFPLLLQVEGQLTYVVALKDAGGLVKMYGMVNVEKYQVVATGDTIQSVQKKYKELLKSNGTEVVEAFTEPIIGSIEAIKVANKDGTSYYYIKLVDKPNYFSLSILDNEEVVLLEVGDVVQLDSTLAINKINDATLISK